MIALIKKNWLVILLIALIVFLAKDRLISPQYSSLPSVYPTTMSVDSGIAGEAGMPKSLAMPYRQSAPPTDNPNRLLITDTNLSLVVTDVPKTIAQIETTTKSLGGFLVNSYLSKPEEGASGTIVVRVPEDKRTDALASFRQFATKIVSESISGDDVTDQYTDLDAQLAVLTQTKAKFQEILAKAVSLNDLLNVQRELINLQSQIDSVVGQQKYLSQSAKLSKITLYLSTDELALPYAPDNSWRPTVIFKQAARSLISSFRQFGSLFIWIVVFIPIWLPILAIFFYLKKRYFKT